jgi:hypothetical protein
MLLERLLHGAAPSHTRHACTACMLQRVPARTAAASPAEGSSAAMVAMSAASAASALLRASDAAVATGGAWVL